MGLRADVAICPIAAGAITSRCYFPLSSLERNIAMNCHGPSAPGTLFMPHPDVPSSVEPRVGVIPKRTLVSKCRAYPGSCSILQETALGRWRLPDIVPVDLDGIDVAPLHADRRGT